VDIEKASQCGQGIAWLRGQELKLPFSASVRKFDPLVLGSGARVKCSTTRSPPSYGAFGLRAKQPLLS